MKKTKTASIKAKSADSPSHLIDARIKTFADWRGAALVRMRALMRSRGVPLGKRDYEGQLRTSSF